MDGSIGDAVAQALHALSAWEFLAVILGIAYLLLAMRENLWCWYAAFASTAIFLFIFWNVDLLMESALQIYYLVMAVYGWWQWQQGNQKEEGLAISRWKLSQHLVAIGGIVTISMLSGALLTQYSNAAMPFLDSFTTWGSVLTTWMVARKILENWLYWFVIDAISIFLYLDRELYLTALLFMAYLVIVLFGFRTWLAHYRATSS
ncbi:MAG: nicotinamide riboside transporter PnuC [Halioglobus sp.]